MRRLSAATLLVVLSAAAAVAALPSLRRCRRLCAERLETCAAQRCRPSYLNKICRRDGRHACAPTWRIPAQPVPPVPGNPPPFGPTVTVETHNGTITISRQSASTVAFHFQPSGKAEDWMWFCTDDIEFLQSGVRLPTPIWVPGVLCRRFDLAFDHRVTAELGPGTDPDRPLTVRHLVLPTDVVLDAVPPDTTSTITTSTTSSSTTSTSTTTTSTTSTSSTSSTSTSSSTSSTTVIPPPFSTDQRTSAVTPVGTIDGAGNLRAGSIQFHTVPDGLGHLLPPQPTRARSSMTPGSLRPRSHGT